MERRHSGRGGMGSGVEVKSQSSKGSHGIMSVFAGGRGCRSDTGQGDGWLGSALWLGLPGLALLILRNGASLGLGGGMRALPSPVKTLQVRKFLLFAEEAHSVRRTISRRVVMSSGSNEGGRAGRGGGSAEPWVATGRRRKKSHRRAGCVREWRPGSEGC